MRSLKSKIVLGFAAVLVLLVVAGTTAAISMNAGERQVEKMISQELELVTVSEQLSKNVSQRIAIVRGYVLFGDNAFLQDFRRYTETSKKLQKRLLELRTDEEAAKLVARNDQWREMVEGELFSSYASGNLDKALNYLSEQSEPVARELMAGFDAVASASLERIDETKTALVQDMSRNSAIMTILSVASVLLGIGVALYLSNSIIRPIVGIIGRIRAIAGGDLSGEPLDSGTKDEIADLAAAMNAMVGSLRRIVSHVHESAERIAASSDELISGTTLVNGATADITEAAREVAAGAMKQTESLSDNAVAMAEMSTVTQRIAEATHTASSVAMEATDEAEQGHEAIRSAVGQMDAIRLAVGRTSDAMRQLGARIGEIHTVLTAMREIAAQTNMLALNASVEAARAGAGGRGFAVVAGEIKKLSDRSAASSKSISELVGYIHADTRAVLSEMEQGVRSIERGTELVDRAGDTFGRIVAGSSRVSADIQEIASAAQQLSAGSEQLAASLSELTSIAEQSLLHSRQVAEKTGDQLEAVAEISASSVALNAMSDTLKTAAGEFKL